LVEKVLQFLKKGIWEVRPKDLSPVKRFLIRDLCVIALTVRGFLSHNCALRASALTYYSLLSVVPLLALVFGIAKGFGLNRLIKSQIVKLATSANWPTGVVDNIVLFSEKMLFATKGGVIAAIGVIVLVWTVISILGHVEGAFNEIWEVRRARSMVRKFTDYMAIMVLAPVLIVISGSLNLVVASQLGAIVRRVELLGVMAPFVSFLFKFLPYLSIWILLTLCYIVMPNTKVKIHSAILAGVVTGTIFQIVQWIYIAFQIGVAKAGAIYGSFAALPLFLAWMQLSWMIVLFGAEIAVADENCDTYGYHPDYARLSHGARKVMGLRILHLLIKRFGRGEEALTSAQIATTLELPLRFVRRLLTELIASDLVAEVARDGNNGVGFQPAQDTELLTIEYAIRAYERHGRDVPTGLKDEEIAVYLRAISEEVAASPKNVLIKNI
jgi:membrane protein